MGECGLSGMMRQFKHQCSGISLSKRGIHALERPDSRTCATVDAMLFLDKSSIMILSFQILLNRLAIIPY